MYRSISVSTTAFFVSIVVAFLWLLPHTTAAQSASQCTFSTTLEMGVIDDSVLCLQKYLNANGYPIASDGPGSPGNETNKFGSLTEAAVIKWQTANKVSPAMGIFGSVSQAKYKSLQGGSTVTVDTEAPSTGQQSDDIAYLLGLLNDLKAQQNGGTPAVAGDSTDAATDSRVSAERELTAALTVILDTFAQLEDFREDDAEEAVDISDDTVAALDLFADALKAYFAGDYKTATADASDALDDATDSLEDAGGESAASEAEDKLDDVEDFYAEVLELFEEAEDDDADVGDAEDLLEEARDFLDDAQAAFDARNYRQAVSDAFDAEDLLEDAESEIDLLSDRDAEDYLDEMWDEYETVSDEIDEAADDGDDVDVAEDYLKDANRALKKADIALDEEDYREVVSYTEDAEALLKKAQKAIGQSGDDEESEAEDMLADAWDEFEDAWDEFEAAEDDGDRTGDAEDLLEEAEDLLDDAEDALDDEDWDEVEDLVEEALDLIEEALDEL